nr:hypothetical protein GCM10017745_61460 [Saccharothrix mutabilis subsp. capreolus]
MWVDYELFEGMHYVCFHYEFEHLDADPDDDCGVAGCPSAPAARHNDRLTALVEALRDDWSHGPPANWDHHTLPDFLGALADRLRGAEAHYAARGRSLPWNSWEVVGHALRAATVHEWRDEDEQRRDPSA